VLTGGASAIYGADAVSGVVNFIMKRDFEGIAGRAQAGISSRGDSGQRLITLTAGHNFAGDRGNITLAWEHGEEDRLDVRQRGYLSFTSGPRSSWAKCSAEIARGRRYHAPAPRSATSIHRDRQRAVALVDAHGGAIGNFAAEQLFRERILQVALDRALQGAGAIDRIVAVFREPGARLVVELQRYAALFKAFAHAPDLDVDDARHLRLEQAMEQQDFIKPVEELGPECAAHNVHDLVADRA
jgi:hypothetical protein